MVQFVGVTAALMSYVVYTSTMASDIANKEEYRVDMAYMNREGYQVQKTRPGSFHFKESETLVCFFSAHTGTFH